MAAVMGYNPTGLYILLPYLPIMKIYQVDAFADGPFTGNPAAVVPLVKWLDDHTLQNIAAENNLSETAFFIPHADNYHLRWFTPTSEVRLCGHATFAAAYVLFDRLDFPSEHITFHTLSGPLYVSRLGDDSIQLDLPTDILNVIDIDDGIIEALGGTPIKELQGREDYLIEYENESAIRLLRPDFSRLKSAKVRGIITTAKGDNVDFVSRCFYPNVGIDEDPATGSAHTSLTPYWANRLGKDQLVGRQLSKRVGYFECELNGDRTLLKGRGRLFLEGAICM